MKPDRVVVGTRQTIVLPVLEQLYAPYLRTGKPFLDLSPESAEMTKYVANCFLATKISFINEMANICEQLGADINEVRQGIGFDSRIGFSFLFPGCGYGGSCFPKDVQALISMSADKNAPPRILRAVQATNAAQKHRLTELIVKHFGDLRGRVITVWGLAFKPGTDDIREAPSLVLIDDLLSLGAGVRVHDPVAMDNVRQLYGDRLVYCLDPMVALTNVDALAIVTEWKNFVSPDFDRMHRLMSTTTIFDGRNIFNPAQMAQEGFTYYSIGQHR
jgi:UDPglucose 6-dehydrogenase